MGVVSIEFFTEAEVADPKMFTQKLNRIISQLQQEVINQSGGAGTVKLGATLDMQGNSIINVGPSKATL
jgi:hypothetical protein